MYTLQVLQQALQVVALIASLLAHSIAIYVFLGGKPPQFKSK